MKIFLNAGWFLLRLIFGIFGLNEFLHFITMLPPFGVTFAGIFQDRVETKTTPVRRGLRVIHQPHYSNQFRPNEE